MADEGASAPMAAADIEDPGQEGGAGHGNIIRMVAVVMVVALGAGGGYLLLGSGSPNFEYPEHIGLTTSWNKGSGEQFPGYVGCFKDDWQNRSLPERRLENQPVTAEFCNRACADSGFGYFGLQFGSECFCGNGPHIGEQADGNECNQACAADPQQICGAAGRNSVYRVDPNAGVSCGECGCLDAEREAVLCVVVAPVWNRGDGTGTATLSLALQAEAPGDPASPFTKVGTVSAEIPAGTSARMNLAVYRDDLADLEDGVVHVVLRVDGRAEDMVAFFTKAGTMLSIAECPGSSGHYCEASTCCPGIEATGGKTFPCPIAKLAETSCQAEDPQKAVLDALVAHMTRDEKHRFLRGTGNFGAYGYYIGNSGREQRFGIPSVNMQDSGNGFRNDQLGGGDVDRYVRGPQQVTSYPCALALASLWSEDHMARYGTALGQEFRKKGANMILGPAVNVHRVPRNGRNAEYLSGESPYLGARLTKPYIRAVQAEKVLSSVKHWINNNQETCRHETDAITDDRTRWELYYPPFEAAVQADVAAQMCGYNFVNGEMNCQSRQIMQVELKDKMGFKGWVQSDWWALDSFDAAIDAGIDQEMPGGDYFTWDRLHTLSEERVNTMMTPQLEKMLQYGLFEVVPGESCISGGGCNALYYDNVVATPESRDFSKEITTKAVTLLKNGGALPLNIASTRKIALLGRACHKLVSMSTQLTDWQMSSYYFIGGSGRIIGRDPVTIYKGLQEKCTGGVDRSFQGCYWDDENDRMFEHKAMTDMSTPALCRDACGAGGYTYFGLQFKGECYCGNSLAKGVPAYEGECFEPCDADPKSYCGAGNRNSVYLVADPGPSTGDCEIVTEFSDDSAAAITKASGADVAIICGGTSGTEDIDRADLSVAEETFMREVAAGITGVPVVALTMTPGTIVMPWIDDVDAAMNLFLGGEFTGNAFTAALFGDSNPSAKSPIAYPVSEASTIPPCMPPSGMTCEQARPDPCPYTEGLFIGWYNMTESEILFPFGHGLSYTSWAYEALVVHTDPEQVARECPDVDADRAPLILCVTATIRNGGAVAGVEVAQLYMGYPAEAEEPPRVLRGFNRLPELAPTESATARFPIYRRDVQVFSNTNLEWEDVVCSGACSFQVFVGTSSAETPLQGAFTPPSPGRAAAFV